MNISKRSQKSQTDQDNSLGLDELDEHFARASLTLSHSLTFIQARQTIVEFHIELESQADFPWILCFSVLCKKISLNFPSKEGSLGLNGLLIHRQHILQGTKICLLLTLLKEKHVFKLSPLHSFPPGWLLSDSNITLSYSLKLRF